MLSTDLCTGETSKAFGHAMKSSVTPIAQAEFPLFVKCGCESLCLFMYKFKILKGMFCDIDTVLSQLELELVFSGEEFTSFQIVIH